jgi:hypothetical protein
MKFVHTPSLQIEESLKKFANSFLKSPFMHRTEHSIHMQIANYLSECPDLQKTPTVNLKIGGIDNNIWTTSRIQKEWPTGSDISEEEQFYNEPIPDVVSSININKSKKSRRGNFDLAILPYGINNESIDISDWRQFYNGHLPYPSVVIEVGLDYKAKKHLMSDLKKVYQYSTKCDAYFVHLYRDRASALNSEFADIEAIKLSHPSFVTLFSDSNKGESAQSSAMAVIGYLPLGSE